MTPADLEAIADCTTIFGDLIIFIFTPTSDALTSITLPSGLHTITGNMIASGAAISDPQETNFKGIEAPGLTSVGEADSTAFDSILSQIDNPDNVQFNFTPGFSLQTFPSLNQMGFPSLSSVGGNFLVAQNPDLGDINLPLLSTIGGNLDVTGDFNSLELPDLNYVGGGVNVQSSSPTFKCPIPKLRTNGDVHGDGFVCLGNVHNPVSGITGANVTVPETTASTTSSGSPSGATNTPAHTAAHSGAIKGRGIGKRIIK